MANVNDAPTGGVTISGTATQGQTLTAGNDLVDADGMGTVAYQWQANGSAITGATGASYVLTEAEVGKTITVTARYTDGHGTAESKTSAATTAVANVNDAPTGGVTISGTATQGQTLTAGNDLVDADGMGTVAYQWQANGSAITGATGASYVLTEAEVGKTITVTARYTDGHGTAESKTSAATTAVANVNDAPTGGVTISGTPTQGQTLTAGNTLSDADGLGTISYQWKAGGEDIPGATGDTFKLTEAQVGKTITVIVSYTDGHGASESKTSEALASTVANVNDAPTGGVTISGTATQGQTLEVVSTLADADGLGTISYQWKAGGEDIPGATGNTFKLTEAQVGKTITVTVSYTDGHGAAESKTSGATAAVADTRGNSALTVTGTPTQGEMLTATVTDPENVTGNIDYQWYADGVPVSGATSSSFTLAEAQVGKAISVALTYTDGAGNTESKTSASTSRVANVDDEGSVTVSGALEQGATLTATVADPDGITPDSVTYQWYAGGVPIAGATGATFTLTQAEVGQAITVSAAYADAKSGARTAGSTSTAGVANIDDPGVVTIAGTATMGQALTVTVSDPDGIPGEVSYQWFADGAALPGATGESLTLTADLVGQAISVRAVYRDAFGAVASVQPPAPTAPVQATSALVAALAQGEPAGSLLGSTGLADTAESGASSPLGSGAGGGSGGSGAPGLIEPFFNGVGAGLLPQGFAVVGGGSPEVGGGAVLGAATGPTQASPRPSLGTLGKQLFMSETLLPVSNSGLQPGTFVGNAGISNLRSSSTEAMTSTPASDVDGGRPNAFGLPQSGGGITSQPVAPRGEDALGDAKSNLPGMDAPVSSPADNNSGGPAVEPGQTPGDAPQAPPGPRTEADGETEIQLAGSVVSLAAFAGVLGSGQTRIDWSRPAGERIATRRRVA